MEYSINDDIDCEPFIPKEQSNLLFYFSFFIFFAGIYAIYKKKYDAVVFCILITLTSLNHWKHPIFGLNRNLDMIIVILAIIYIFVRAIIFKIKSLLFWTFFILGISLYPYGWYLYFNNQIWLSTLSHCVIHICGSASMVLYCNI